MSVSFLSWMKEYEILANKIDLEELDFCYNSGKWVLWVCIG